MKPLEKNMRTTTAHRTIVAIISLGIASCGGPEAPPAPPPPAVEYEIAGTQAIAMSFEFVARTRAREDTAIQARITGNIIERNFDEGQMVEEGSLLYRIDPRSYQAALAAARAELSRANSTATATERNLKRGEELEPDGYISASEMDKLLNDRDSARAAQEAAAAAIDNAEINLGFAEIRAPFTGVAGRSQLSIGDLVSPQSGPLVTLVQRDPMLVDFDVNERTLAIRIKENQERAASGQDPVKFTPRLRLVTGDFYALEGTIDYASNRVNPSTGTVTVTASFANPDGALLPGQFARILVQRGEAEQQLVIPQPAVLEDMQGRYVYTVTDENTVLRKNVTLGQREGVDWVVESGLDEGDKVIVNGIQKVRPGMPVSATPVGAMPHDSTVPPE
jgi:membrane fusion protein (multidrug efflux system)